MKKLSFIKKGLILVAISLPFLTVLLQGRLSSKNYDVETMKIQLKEQVKKNEGLLMKKEELASLDKISNVALDKGLSYNNENIKTIEKLKN